MSKILTPLVAFSFLFLQANAQSLYMPRDVQQAFKKVTRAGNGMPGKNYWQNWGRYHITISATPPNKTIYGFEEITYINNSPDTLKSIVFKLIANVHKPGAVRLGAVGTDYLTDGVHIDSFSINNNTTRWKETPGKNTVTDIALTSPLLPRDSVLLFVKWHQDVSTRSAREGMIDSTTYFLAYFYPRVAVYDDYQGWDLNEFNDMLEMYNDFNNYVLDVQVPKNYLVWATGKLANVGNVLQPTYASKFNQSLTSDNVIHVVNKQDLAAKNVTQQNALNTWRFTASNVSDVALGLSDHYVWDAASVIVDPATKRRASTQAAYNDTAADFQHVTRFAGDALQWLSGQLPGIPYPYEKTTVFQGYADMEYPMMVNDASYRDTMQVRRLATHEISHTYMPFYMGINEARYGFMDEGWATTFDYLLNHDYYGERKADSIYAIRRVAGWIKNSAADVDLPIINPGTAMNASALRNNQYGKASLGYLAMKDLLGDVLFKKCLQEYMHRWNGKHPLPWDFFNTFNDVSGQNLNWFWNNWFFSNNYIDLAVSKMDKAKEGYAVTINNIGGMPVPFNLVVSYSDKTTETIHQSPAIWKQNSKLALVKINSRKTVTSVQIKTGIFLDANETDNLQQAN